MELTLSRFRPCPPSCSWPRARPTHDPLSFLFTLSTRNLDLSLHLHRTGKGGSGVPPFGHIYHYLSKIDATLYYGPWDVKGPFFSQGDFKK